MQTHTNDVWVHTHTHAHAHAHVHIRRDTYMHIDTCKHAHTHTTCTHTYTCTLSVCLSVTLSLPLSLSMVEFCHHYLSVDSWVLPSLSFKRSAKTPHQLASLKVWCVLVEWIMDNTEVKALQHAQHLLKIQVAGPTPERVGCTDSVAAAQEV